MVTIRRLLTIILVLFGIMAIPSTVLANGVGVTPGKLEFVVRPGGKSTQDLQVINQSDQISKFRLYVEGIEESWFEISPHEFTLDPYEIKAVQVAFNPSITAPPEDTEVHICIVSLPQNENLRIGTGIKLKTAVRIMELPIVAIQWWIAFAVIAGIIVIGLVFFFLFFRKRGQKMLKKSSPFFAALLAVLILAGCSAPATSNPIVSSTVVSTRIESHEVTVVVTSDFGRKLMLEQRVSINESTDAMKALQESAQIETAYGGGFVKSINGLTSNASGHQDWFFYINGIAANTGAMDYLLQPGDIESWDFHNWSFQQSIPAVTGFFPFTFNQGYAGNTRPAIIVYGDNFERDAGILRQAMEPGDIARVNCLPISALSQTDKESANLILMGTAESPLVDELFREWRRLGYFAYFRDEQLVILNAGGEVATRHGAGSGLVQATQNPWNPKGTGAAENVVWLISGTDPDGVSAAVDALINRADEIRYSFGVVVSDSEIIKIPQ